MNRTILVTGAAKRIGKQIALLLGRHSFNVIVHYNTSESEAYKTKTEIKQSNSKSWVIQADLSLESDTKRLVEDAFEIDPDLFGIVNAASIIERSDLLSTEPRLLDDMFAINFKAPFMITREFAKKADRGVIINILDANIYKNDMVNYTPYILSKKSLAEFTTLAAKQLGPYIRVNGVAPGLILTKTKEDVEIFDRLTKKLPLKQSGSALDIANTVKFLIDNSYITGEIINVDGGLHI